VRVRVRAYACDFFGTLIFRGFWCLGMIKLEIRRILGEENLKEYVKDMWKVMDLGTTCLYVIVVILRILAYFEVSSWMLDAYFSLLSQKWNIGIMRTALIASIKKYFNFSLNSQFESHVNFHTILCIIIRDSDVISLWLYHEYDVDLNSYIFTERAKIK
jgi:hypothetical protein